jgi:hypothetical protein
MSSTLPSSLSLTSRSSLSLKDTQRQRDRAGASIEGEHPTPRAQRENSSFPRAFLRAQARSRRAKPQKHPTQRSLGSLSPIF